MLYLAGESFEKDCHYAGWPCEGIRRAAAEIVGMAGAARKVALKQLLERLKRKAKKGLPVGEADRINEESPPDGD